MALKNEGEFQNLVRNNLAFNFMVEVYKTRKDDKIKEIQFIRPRLTW